MCREQNTTPKFLIIRNKKIEKKNMLKKFLDIPLWD